jgi:Arc/MetJ-type ribon-helix-helix transcriptional regulator
MSKIRYNFHLGEQTLKALQVVAKSKGESVSEIIRVAIREHLTAVREQARRARNLQP